MRFHGLGLAAQAPRPLMRAASPPEPVSAAARRPAHDLMRMQRTLGNRGVAQLLRGAAGDQSRASATPAPPDTAARVTAMRGRLPAPLLTSVARASGIDLSDVTVHRASAEPGRADAHAYAAGSDIHLAPGADRHLAHEAWHLIQQRQGRVPVTAHANGHALNTDPALENEADVMGARLAAAPATTAVAARVTPPPAAAPLQLKSKFLSITPKEVNAETPIATLSKTFGPYFTAAGQTELYNFGSNSPFLNVAPANYQKSSYNRAGEVVAEIDGSFKGGNGADRDNDVIVAYGHFGVMERAIYGRPDRGNTYDGGHLVEHTLMSGRDADRHGNLAPQENKHFNQSLMRGWERVPEQLQHDYGWSFTYRVNVEYSNDDYTRTGQDLSDAGVLPASLIPSLPPTGALSRADLKAERVTFRRWVPGKWQAGVEHPGGSNFPALSFTHGVQYHNLAPDLATAESRVFGILASLTAHTHPTPLRRTLSGTLAGFINDMKKPSLISLTLAPRSWHQATMFQPEPQDLKDQPLATSTPAGGTPSTLPTAPPGNILTTDFHLPGLVKDIKGAALRSKKEIRGKHPYLKSADTIAKKNSEDYKILREIGLTEKDGRELLKIIHGSKTPALPALYAKADFTNMLLTAPLSVPGQLLMFQVANDVKFIP